MKDEFAHLSDQQIKELRLLLERQSVPETPLIEQQIETLQTQYNPEMGALGAWWDNISASKRNTLAITMTEESQSATKLATAQDEARIAIMLSQNAVREAPTKIKRTNEMEEVTHNRAVGLIRNEQIVIDKATNGGLHAGTYLKTEEKRQLDRLGAETKDLDAARDIYKHDEMTMVQPDFNRPCNRYKLMKSMV